LFAGYRNPHPLEHRIFLRVQTDSSTTPAEVLDSAITDLTAELSLLEERFRVIFFQIDTVGLTKKLNSGSDPREAGRIIDLNFVLVMCFFS
jgi:hypothetical protein